MALTSCLTRRLKWRRSSLMNYRSEEWMWISKRGKQRLWHILQALRPIVSNVKSIDTRSRFWWSAPDISGRSMWDWSPHTNILVPSLLLRAGWGPRYGRGLAKQSMSLDATGSMCMGIPRWQWNAEWWSSIVLLWRDSCSMLRSSHAWTNEISQSLSRVSSAFTDHWPLRFGATWYFNGATNGSWPSSVSHLLMFCCALQGYDIYSIYVSKGTAMYGLSSIWRGVGCEWYTKTYSGYVNKFLDDYRKMIPRSIGNRG